MNKLLVLILTPLFLAHSQNGTPLKGVVTLNELGGSPIAGVQVTSDGANPASTNSDGSFTLIFPKKKPGDIVKLRFLKPGVESIHYIFGEQVLRSDASEVEILLSKKVDREEMARRYFRLKSVEEIEKNYKAQVRILESRHATDSSSLAKLTNERDKAITVSASIANKFAKENLTENTDLYAKATRLFLDGSIDAALALLEDPRIERELAGARETVKKVAKEYMLKGRLLGFQFRVKEAKEAFERAVDIDPKDFETNFVLGYFYAENGLYDQARVSFDSSLQFARKVQSKKEEAVALANLGFVDYKDNRFAEAGTAYKAALKIFRLLAAVGPDSLLTDIELLSNLGGALTNLAVLEMERDNVMEAGDLLIEALGVYQRLVERAPEEFLPNLASIYDQLGILYEKENMQTDARRTHENALIIERQLYARNTDKYASDLAGMLVNTGNMYRNEGRLVDAQKAYEEALKISRTLSSTTPKAYLSLAACLDNLGVIYRDEQRMIEAQRACEEALGIRRQVAVHSPIYLRLVATNLNNLGLIYADMDSSAKAHKAYDEALFIQRSLSVQDSNAHLSELSTTLLNLGVLYLNEKKTNEALESYKESLEIRRLIARKNPQAYLPQVVIVLGNIGLLLMNDDKKQAKEAYEEAVRLWRTNSVRNPSVHFPNMGQTLNNLGILYLGEKRAAEAEVVFKESLKFRRELAEQKPETYLVDVAATLNNLAVVYKSINRVREACENYSEALKIYQGLAAITPDKFQNMVNRIKSISSILCEDMK